MVAKEVILTPNKRQTTRVAAYGLVLQEKRILLCRLSHHVPKHVGHWTLPGGGLDFGEDPAAALVREVYEETGLTVAPLGVAGVDSSYRDHEDHGFHAVRIVYRTALRAGTLTNERGGSTDLCAWWSLAEALRLPLVDLSVYGLGLAFAAKGHSV